MKFDYPFLINRIKAEKITYIARPLFFENDTVINSKLQTAIQKQVGRFQNHLGIVASNADHSSLLSQTYVPEFKERRIPLAIKLEQETRTFKLLCIEFEKIDFRILFIPQLAYFWCTVPKQHVGIEHIQDLVDKHVEQMGEGDRESYLDPVNLEARTWIHWAPLHVATQKQKLGSAFDLISLGGEEELDGQEELRKVGHCLENNEMKPALKMKKEKEQLAKLLAVPNHAPILVIGPRGRGKTALIHDYHYSKARGLHGNKAKAKATWQVTPQRLISGMSLVGQWENRVRTIIEYLENEKHILYIDDLTGLFRAGISAGSKLTVAHVLKPFLAKGRIRLLGECTAETFAKIRELDRGFADLFQIVRLQPPSDKDNLLIHLQAVRNLEADHQCCFEPSALPMVLQLTRRYQKDAGYPGKGIRILRRLAKAGKNINRASVLKDFTEKSGLSLGFLDDSVSLTRAEIIAKLQESIVGQDGCLQALADAVLVAKAGLNDPHKPLATFLFLGPTGVGKTQVAKSLAAYLYGNENRLLRIDMNEFVDPYAVPRLVGTFHEPDGLLTREVRRNPFTVLLLDEIEKADRSVFDLLLQVLGEGRLTDALGRTVDFTNMIIIMTSNLGAREAAKHLGFQKQEQRLHAYRRAARDFFRPEFSNRIDRVIPFNPLDAEHIRDIARLQIEKLKNRVGFMGRRMGFYISREVLDLVSARGFDAELGARALKREVQSLLAVPLSRALSAGSPDAVSVIQLGVEPDDTIAVKVAEVKAAAGRPAPYLLYQEDHQDPETLRTAVKRQVDRLRATRLNLDKEHPGGQFELGEQNLEHQCYYALQEWLHQAENTLGNLEKTLDIAIRYRHNPKPVPFNNETLIRLPEDFDMEAAAIGKDIAQRLQNQSKKFAPLLKKGALWRLAEELRRIELETNLIQYLSEIPMEEAPGKVILSFVPVVGKNHAFTATTVIAYKEFFEKIFDLSCHYEIIKKEGGSLHCLCCEGLFARQLLKPQAGLVMHLGGDLFLLKIGYAEIAETKTFEEAMAEADPWNSELFPLPALSQISHGSGFCLDLRAGSLVGHPHVTPKALYDFTLAALRAGAQNQEVP